MTPSPGPSSVDRRRPVSSQTISVNGTWTDGNTSAGSSSRGLQLKLSQCFETRTTETTTKITRTHAMFDPWVTVKESRPLESLDPKEYPLASQPVPEEFLRFSFNVQLPEPGTEVLQQTPKRIPTTAVMSTADASNTPSRSPSEPYSLRARRTNVLAESPKGSRSSSGQSQIPSDKLRRLAHGIRRDQDRSGKQSSGFLATPDSSGLASSNVPDRASRPRSLVLDKKATTPETVPSQSTAPYDAASPLGSESTAVFSSSVATPPITDADPEPFPDADESLQAIMAAQHARATSEVAAAQDVSLPSPRLSPTLAAAQLYSADSHDHSVKNEEDDVEISSAHASSGTPRWLPDSPGEDGSQGTTPLDLASRSDRIYQDWTEFSHAVNFPSVQAMLNGFDGVPDEAKPYVLYQILQRCPRKTLRAIAGEINSTFQCDFLKQLPLELSYHVLSYLDHRDLCRAAQVSKHWRSIIDSNETGWKELLDRDGFILPAGELDKAIRQGWGWQDPVGAMGCEVDLSVQTRLTSSEAELTRSVKVEQAYTAQHLKLRSSKRKRGLTSYAGPERSKRRASAQEPKQEVFQDLKHHKSEGPLSAASAAAAAVPDPQLGIPSLRKLHLFKSLYRRHYMIQQSWNSGKVKPSHVAFVAHPRHVITCLQFDEDKIITGSDDTLIHIYDTKTGVLRKKLEGHEGGVWALQYEGNVLVSGSTDRSVRVWDIEKGLCTQVFYGHTSTVRCLQILMPTEVGKGENGKPKRMPPKPLIITGSRDSQLRVWRLPETGSRRYIQTGPPANDADCPYFIRTLQGHNHSVRAISAHGDTLVSGSYDSTVRVWRISTGEARHVLHGHSQKVYSVVLDHQRNRCISGAMDSFVKIWNLDTGSCLFTLEGHSLLVGLLDLRDERLVSAAADSTLRIWDPENGKCRNVLTAHTGAITCFQHDGRKVISGSEKTVKMWDIASGNCMQDLLTDLNGVWQVKFDDRRCVAAVQRESLTYVEILDFGAVRDGKPPEELGKRILLNEAEVDRLLEEEI